MVDYTEAMADLDAEEQAKAADEAKKTKRPKKPSNGNNGEAYDFARGEPKTEAAAPTPRTLTDVVFVFRKWLALKNARPVYVVLGAVGANLLAGDPVWLGLIAPPSSAKTELLSSLSTLAYVRAVETFTPAALLSGTSRKQRAKEATGGVLREIGQFGVLLFKDFGSVLEMRHEQRADMMAALRRIYDGEYTRKIGEGGGRSLDWRGKAGAIFGGTQSYDSHHAVAGTLGDRFILFRVETMVEEQLDKCRLQSGANAKKMREEIAQAVAGLFASLPRELPDPEPMNDDEYETLSDVIKIVIRLRAGVVRDGYRREITDVHDPEGPARLSKALQQLFAGLVLIGVDRAEALEIIVAVAHDSAPKIRVKTYEALTDDWQTIRAIAATTKYPSITARRALEELHAQGLALLKDGVDEEEAAAAQTDLYEPTNGKKKKDPAGAFLWKRAT